MTEPNLGASAGCDASNNWQTNSTINIAAYFCPNRALRIAASARAPTYILIQIPFRSLEPNWIPAQEPSQLRIVVPSSIVEESGFGVEASAGVGVGIGDFAYGPEMAPALIRTWRSAWI